MLAFGTCFQLIVFAGYNGLTETLESTLSLFDPQIKVERKDHRYFAISDSLCRKIQSISNINAVSKVISGDVALTYKDVQMVAPFKGVDSNYKAVNRIDTMVIMGEYKLEGPVQDYAIMGFSLKSRLHVQMNSSNPYKIITLYYPNRKIKIGKSEKSFNKGFVYPVGAFAVEPRFDNSLLISYNLASQITNHEGECTSLEIQLKNIGEIEEVKEVLSTIFGDEFEYLSRREQRKSLYKALETEKLVVGLILVALLALCSLSVYLTVLMIVIAKQKDLAVLKSLGATEMQLRLVILKQAIHLCLRGVLIGVVLGLTIVFLQKEFELLTIDQFGNAFPVNLTLKDAIFSICSTSIIALLMSWQPAKKAGKLNLQDFI